MTERSKIQPSSGAKLFHHPFEKRVSELEKQIEKQINMFYHKKIIKYISFILTFLLAITIGILIYYKIDYERYKKTSNIQINELKGALTSINILANKESSRLEFLSFADTLISNRKTSDLSTQERILTINSIWSNCKEFNINPYVMLSLIEQESGFRKLVKSEKNAYGLCQFIKPTFKTCAKLLYDDSDISNIYDINKQIRYSVFYVRLLYDLTNDMHMALTMYNTGNADKINSYSYAIMRRASLYENEGGSNAD